MIGKAGRRNEVGVDDESDGSLRARDDHHPKLFSEVYVKIAREDVVGQGPGRQLVPVPAPHGPILGPSPPLGHIVDLSRVRRLTGTDLDHHHVRRKQEVIVLRKNDGNERSR